MKKGEKPSSETRARMSAAAKARCEREKAAGRSPWAAACRVNTGRSRPPEVRAKISATLLGVPRPWVVEFNRRASTRASRAATMRSRIAAGSAPFLRTVKRGTAPEQAMSALLEWAGVQFESQKQIVGKVVDFYFPASRAVIEVDGVYWHPDGIDLERDARLLAAGASFVHHITDRQLKVAGWL